jgi:citrate synthase
MTSPGVRARPVARVSGPEERGADVTDSPSTASNNDRLTVRDNRTGQEYDVPIVDGTIRAADIGKIGKAEDTPGLAVYDPGFVNTASCRSAVTFIDGEKGILEYRGYPIEQLAEKSSYLEVAYLLVHGELPTKVQYESWAHEITYHTFVHENVRDFMEGFRYDAHPMGMLLASVGALSTFYPESRNISDADNRHMQVVRLIAKMPTLGAWAFRHAQGKPYIYPDNDLGYAANFLAMLFKMSERRFEADPRLIHALEVLFILHADHEQNCSTNAVRSVGSSQVDPYSAVSAGIAALFGPLHGGANEAVLRMLRRIGSVDKVPEFIEGVKNGKEKLMGFGHRVYKNHDPRATIIKKACDDVFEVTGVNPLLKIAVELEKIALEDDYFVSRKLYPNVDFYSGLIYEALQFPPEMFTVLFAIPRTSGWLSQWLELVQDPEQKIARPKQIYTGARTLDFVPATERWK